MKIKTYNFTIALLLAGSYIVTTILIVWMVGVGGLFIKDVKLIASILLGGLAAHATFSFQKLRKKARSDEEFPSDWSWIGISIISIFALGIPCLLLAKASKMGNWRPNNEDFALVLGMVQALYNAFVPLLLDVRKVRR
jgi:hypothetical protein